MPALKLNALETRRTVCDVPFLFEINQHTALHCPRLLGRISFYTSTRSFWIVSVFLFTLLYYELFLCFSDPVNCLCNVANSKCNSLDFFAGSITISFGNAVAKFCSMLQATYFLFLANNGMLFAKISAR